MNGWESDRAKDQSTDRKGLVYWLWSWLCTQPVTLIARSGFGEQAVTLIDLRNRRFERNGDVTPISVPKPGRATPTHRATHRQQTPDVLLDAVQALSMKTKHEPREGALILRRLGERCR